MYFICYSTIEKAEFELNQILTESLLIDDIEEHGMMIQRVVCISLAFGHSRKDKMLNLSVFHQNIKLS